MRILQVGLLVAVLFIERMLGQQQQQQQSAGGNMYGYGAPQEERYLDAAPESMLPPIPWPEWLPRDLSSLPKSGLQYLPMQGGQSSSSVASKTVKIPASPGFIPPAFGGGFPSTGGRVSSMRRYPRGDPRNCIKEGDTTNIMQVVPGLGWDNLRNLETGMVTSFSYSQCKVTYDRQYLIPDETFSIPIKSSIVEQNSDLLDKWDSYKSVTSRSINSGFDFFGRIGGKFSNEYLNLKSRQFNEKAITMRTELRHRLHTIKQLPDSRLHPGFKNRLLDILSLLKSNDSRAANYAGQLLIRDYGTHYLTSVDAGAVLVKEDNLKSTILANYKGRTNTITAAGGADFFNVIKLQVGTSFSSGSSELDAYRNHRTSSKLMTYGGPTFHVGMDISEWENNLPNNLVPVDRSGKPIHSVITSDNLKPEVTSNAEVYLLKRLVQDVASKFYAFNTHIGCTDQGAPNFDYQANSPFPGACQAASPNFTLGGVFQRCSYISNANGLCQDLTQKNPITGGYSCPSGYESVLLLEGTAYRPKTDKSCKFVKKCAFWVFKCRHDEVCEFFEKTEKAKHQTFWCAPSKKKKLHASGYLFGGIYSNDLNNPVTRARSCPNHFISMKIGSHAHICLSEDYELGQQFSLPFGGFFSCVGGNKLAAANATSFLNNPRDWPMRCPMGFTQHLALTDNDCRVNFCVKAGTLQRATDLDIVLPPFEPMPTLKENSTTELFEAINPRVVAKAYSYAQSKLAQSNVVEHASTAQAFSGNGARGTFGTVWIVLVFGLGAYLIIKQ